MVPGQEVNKDVYAVNTGNIAAFVKEDVSTVLDFTYEDVVSAINKDCVTLNKTTVDAIDGVTTYEAGGFLAWTDAEESTTTSAYTINNVDGYTMTPVTQVAYASDTAAETTTKTFKYKYEKDGETTYYAEGNDDGESLYTLSDGTVSGVGNDKKVYADASQTLGKTDTTTTSSVDVGAVNVVLGEGNGWAPTERGAYIFRRKITNNAAPTADTFTYAGYYFVPAGEKLNPSDTDALTEDTYYKIVIGNDTYSREMGTDAGGTSKIVFDIYADQENVQTLGATIDENGTIKGTVDYRFVEEKKSGPVTPTLTFEDAVTNSHPARLVAQYALGNSASSGDYDATAQAARKEMDYENAKKFSELADELYGYAKADVDYATALATERNALIDAAKAAVKASGEEDEAKTAKDNAWDDLFSVYDQYKTEYDKIVTANASLNDFTDLNPESFVPQSVRNAAEAHVGDSSTPFKYPRVNQFYTELQALYGTDEDSGMRAYIKAINAANTNLTSYKGISTKDKDPADIQKEIDIIKTNLKKLKTDLGKYKQKYADLVNSAVTDATVSVQSTDNQAKKNAIQGVIDQVTTTQTKAEALDTQSALYKTAYGTWDSKKTASSGAQSDWETAVDTYNKNVGSTEGALKTYTTAIGSASHSQNHSAAISNAYSINTSGGDPTIQPAANVTTAKAHPENYSGLEYKDPKSTAADGDHTADRDAIANALDINLTYTNTGAFDTTSYEYPAAAATSTTQKLADWESFKNTKNNAAATAKKAYDDAVKVLDEGSAIKFFINLADDYATNWTFDRTTDNLQTASFYYNKILEAGETSDKLIDSVTLADTVTAKDYKELTFDVNVALDSAQVTYADDQKTYTATAVQDPFKMKVASIENNEDVTWTKEEASTKVVYKVSGTTVNAPKAFTSTVLGLDTYKWEIEYNGDRYVGISRLDGSTFKHLVADGSALGTNTDITLNVTKE